MHDHATGPLTGPHPMTPTGRALWVCLGPAGHPGRWTDNTTGARGNLLDLIARQRGDANNDTASAHAAERLLARCRSPRLPPASATRYSPTDASSAGACIRSRPTSRPRSASNPPGAHHSIRPGIDDEAGAHPGRQACDAQAKRGRWGGHAQTHERASERRKTHPNHDPTASAENPTAHAPETRTPAMSYRDETLRALARIRPRRRERRDRAQRTHDRHRRRTDRPMHRRGRIRRNPRAPSRPRPKPPRNRRARQARATAQSCATPSRPDGSRSQKPDPNHPNDTNRGSRPQGRVGELQRLACTATPTPPRTTSDRRSRHRAGEPRIARKTQIRKAHACRRVPRSPSRRRCCAHPSSAHSPAVSRRSPTKPHADTARTGNGPRADEVNAG